MKLQGPIFGDLADKSHKNINKTVPIVAGVMIGG